jgi:regulation of enolase protein 1 (concanavalin A-like superfamily)
MYANGRFTITGGGPDIWNTADGFHFVYQPWSGDGEIVAHVTYFEYGHYSCKAGLMFRESLDTASVNIGASMEIDSAGTYKVCSHSRKSMGALSDGKYSARGYRTPQWLRLRRSAEIFTTAVSPDGATWTAVYVDTVAMASSGYVGLAVTSHDTTRLSTAVFEHVTAR